MRIDTQVPSLESEPIGPAGDVDEVRQLRARVERLERLTLDRAIENEHLADENERLRAEIEALSVPRGVRGALTRGWRG